MGKGVEIYRHEFNPGVSQGDRREPWGIVLHFHTRAHTWLSYMHALKRLPIKPVKNANIFLTLFKKLTEKQAGLISEKRKWKNGEVFVFSGENKDWSLNCSLVPC